MNASSALLVVVGAAVGAPLRFVVDRWAREHTRAGTILGTLVVNVAGSLVLGLVAGLRDAPDWVLPLVGIGFCGALTTFSTLAFETWVFFEERAWRAFAANLALTFGLGLPAVWLGFLLG
ncbi:CrcB protein [Phycicoccus badiiscoriae]|uniref:Fluoride-specific ion channel FluC n=1 Tax=Pedococcus badiiscoriae TaxID=642776 RepID=A0A852WKH9_9MICO|nr:CrcB family protein [Pedococcus badiiscoriae]NYG06735.1 CrcB protein [Pedococcus badiiscoriae]